MTTDIDTALRDRSAAIAERDKRIAALESLLRGLDGEAPKAKSSRHDESRTMSSKLNAFSTTHAPAAALAPSLIKRQHSIENVAPLQRPQQETRLQHESKYMSSSLDQQQPKMVTSPVAPLVFDTTSPNEPRYLSRSSSDLRTANSNSNYNFYLDAHRPTTRPLAVSDSGGTHYSWDRKMPPTDSNTAGGVSPSTPRLGGGVRSNIAGDGRYDYGEALRPKVLSVEPDASTADFLRRSRDAISNLKASNPLREPTTASVQHVVPPAALSLAHMEGGWRERESRDADVASLRMVVERQQREIREKNEERERLLRLMEACYERLDKTREQVRLNRQPQIYDTQLRLRDAELKAKEEELENVQRQIFAAMNQFSNHSPRSPVLNSTQSSTALQWEQIRRLQLDLAAAVADATNFKDNFEVARAGEVSAKQLLREISEVGLSALSPTFVMARHSHAASKLEHLRILLERARAVGCAPLVVRTPRVAATAPMGASVADRVDVGVEGSVSADGLDAFVRARAFALESGRNIFRESGPPTESHQGATLYPNPNQIDAQTAMITPSEIEMRLSGILADSAPQPASAHVSYPNPTSPQRLPPPQQQNVPQSRSSPEISASIVMWDVPAPNAASGVSHRQPLPNLLTQSLYSAQPHLQLISQPAQPVADHPMNNFQFKSSTPVNGYTPQSQPPNTFQSVPPLSNHQTQPQLTNLQESPAAQRQFSPRLFHPDAPTHVFNNANIHPSYHPSQPQHRDPLSNLQNFNQNSSRPQPGPPLQPHYPRPAAAAAAAPDPKHFQPHPPRPNLGSPQQNYSNPFSHQQPLVWGGGGGPQTRNSWEGGGPFGVGPSQPQLLIPPSQPIRTVTPEISSQSQSKTTQPHTLWGTVSPPSPPPTAITTTAPPPLHQLHGDYLKPQGHEELFIFGGPTQPQPQPKGRVATLAGKFSEWQVGNAPPPSGSSPTAK